MESARCAARLGRPAFANALLAAVDEVERHHDCEHDHEGHADEKHDAGQGDQRRAGAPADLCLVLERLRRLDRVLDRMDDVLRLLLEVGHVSFVPKTATAYACRSIVRTSRTRRTARVTVRLSIAAPRMASRVPIAFAIAGPSTCVQPCSAAFTNPNCATIAHSHGRELNSRQPSPRSAKKVEPSMRRLAGMRMRTVKSAARKKLPASQAIPTPGLVAPTISPPSAAPPMKLLLRPSRRSAFALCSSGLGTVCGTIPVEAGKKNAELAPFAAASAPSCQMRAWPERSSAATTAWLRPLTTLETTIPRCRGSRSAQIPPASRKSTCGSERAART